jgi:outer membrane protein
MARSAAVAAAIALTAAGRLQAAADSSDTASSTVTDYHLAVGPGDYWYPQYPGSRNSRQLLFPFVDAEYANRIYTSAADLLGVYGYKTETAEVGAALEYDPTRRKTADDPLLRGPSNVKDTTRFKLFGSRTIGIVTGDMNVARDIEGHRQGTLGQANLWLTAPFDPTFSVSAGPGVTWADGRYMHTFYAVTQHEAMTSYLPAFATRAGIADAHWNGLAEWQLWSKYRLGAEATFAHLKGDAADSPISMRHQQTTVTGWIAYRFN